MADWDSIAEGLWRGFAALKPQPANEEAQKSFQLAFVGAAESGKSALARVLAAEPPGDSIPERLQPYLAEYRLPLSAEDVHELESATLLILLLDSTQADFVDEVAAADYLSYLGRPILVCYSKMDLVPVETRLMHGQARWRGAEIMPLTAVGAKAVKELLVPKVLDVLPGYSLALARRLPLFRELVAEQVVIRTAQVTATYASATGLTQRIPLHRMPLNEDDTRVLGANQAAMIYRLGLTHGLKPGWHAELAPLQSAVDPSALWRLLARRAVGWIPLWGLNSKVSLVYSGTVAMGRAVQFWLNTGQPLSEEALRELCREVATETRETSDDVAAKARDALPAPEPKPTGRRRWGLRLGRKDRLPRPSKPVCPSCLRVNPRGATFCAYCGVALVEAESCEVQSEAESREVQSEAESREVQSEAESREELSDGESGDDRANAPSVPSGPEVRREES